MQQTQSTEAQLKESVARLLSPVAEMCMDVWRGSWPLDGARLQQFEKSLGPLMANLAVSDSNCVAFLGQESYRLCDLLLRVDAQIKALKVAEAADETIREPLRHMVMPVLKNVAREFAANVEYTGLVRLR